MEALFIKLSTWKYCLISLIHSFSHRGKLPLSLHNDLDRCKKNRRKKFQKYRYLHFVWLEARLKVVVFFNVCDCCVFLYYVYSTDKEVKLTQDINLSNF